MKTWIHPLFALCVLSLALFSCEKDEERLVLSAGTAPALTASRSSLELQEEQADDDALTLNWTASDFGYPAAVKYTLQLDLKGNNFAAPIVVDMTGRELSRKFAVREINTLLNRLPVTAFSENEIEARMVASVSAHVDAVNSNVITIKATPYLTEPPYATLYMVGDATEFEWDNQKATPMYRSEEDVFIYTFTGPLKAGNLKFLGERGKWAPMWGNAGSDALVFREKEADPDPASFAVATAGYYTVNVDLRNMRFSMAPYNATGARTFASVGIIGAFNGWGDIVPMKSTAFNPHAWSLEHTFDADTELKFRHAPNWDVNWGTDQGKETDPFGKGKQGGENMKVSAGTYQILFNDLTGHYVFIKK